MRNFDNLLERLSIEEELLLLNTLLADLTDTELIEVLDSALNENVKDELVARWNK